MGDITELGVVRDDFDAQKPEWEKELGEIFGVPWTVEINQNELYAYAADNSDSEIKSRPGYTCAKCVRSPLLPSG